MKKSLLLAVLAGATMCTFQGCSNDLDAPMSMKDQIKELNSRFDFNCWTDVPVTIDAGRPAIVKIYDCDPAVNERAVPLAEVTTGANGVYKGKLNMGSGVFGQKLWAVTSDMTVVSTVNEKGVVFSNAGSRDISEFGIKSACKTLDKMYHEMLQEGDPNIDDVTQSEALAENRDINIHTIKEGEEEQYSQIMVSMIDHGDALDVQLYYFYYKTGTDDSEAGRLQHFKNTFSSGPVAFHNQFHDVRFRIKPDEDVNMDGGWNTSSRMGASKMLKFYGENYDQPGTVNFPSGYTIGFMLRVDYHGNGSRVWYQTTEHGIGSFLVNPDEADRAANPGMWTTWDKGTGIHDTQNRGLGNVNDENGLLMDYAGCYDVSKKVSWPEPFTDEEFGMEDADNHKQWKANMSRLLYGFEDYPGGYDRDYNDLMFLTTVYGKIKDNIQEWGSNTVYRSGTYLFEDLYPLSGDYDMNDVIVRYSYKANVNDIGAVTKFEYSIEPVWDGADYVNDFYLEFVPKYGPIVYKKIYANNKTQLGKVFKGFARRGADDEILSGSYECNVVTTNGNVKEVEIEGSRVSGDDFAAAFIGQPAYMEGREEDDRYSDLFVRTNGDYETGVEEMAGGQVYRPQTGVNPFILCTNTGYEIHLTGYCQSHAKVGNCDESSLLHKYYFTDLKHNWNMPFAIDIPILEFEPVTEKTPIYMEYSNMIQWIESHAFNRYAGWYLQKSMPATGN